MSGRNGKTTEDQIPWLPPRQQKIIRYILSALIAGFFAIPLVTLCLVDGTFLVPKRAASILLFFSR